MADTNTIDPNLRPKNLQTYIGQQNVRKTLSVFIEAVKNRGEASEHILFYGPPGIGKTTLAHIIANELTGDIKITSGTALSKSGDLAAILTNLQDRDVLFIDEIHRLPKNIEEMLYPVMEEYSLDIVIGKGPSARTVRLPVPKITIVAATTRLALLSAPMRDRFGLLLRLDYYTDSEMEEIVNRSSQLMSVPLTKQSIKEIAKRSRRTPRIANRILKRVRDTVEVEKLKEVDDTTLHKLFKILEIDEKGLTKMDQSYIHAIGVKFHNQPVGVNTLSSTLGEDIQTIEEYIEPYLLQIGYIKKTSRGRVLTPQALAYLKLPTDSGVQQDPLLI